MHATRHQVIAGVLAPRGVRAGTDAGRTWAAEGHGRCLIFCTRNRTDPISGFAKNGDAPESRSRQSSPSPPSWHPRAGQTIPPGLHLIRRLRERRNEALRFLTDWRVPFDNNQTERDLRMPKFKQKASGCFRSDTGAGDFAIIRSYLSTLRKQSDDLFNALVLTFQGRPPMPQLE